MKKFKLKYLFLPLLFFILSSQVEASHRTLESQYKSKINRLDDDIVKNLPIPLLFAITVDDIYPNFGDPRDGGARTHEGLDLIVKRGTPIVSPTEAVVLRTGDGSGSGLYVRTANPGGEQFVYMHLDEISNEIKAGDVLKPGDFIGLVGDTGNAKGVTPHLHFEIREREAKDPYPRLTKTFDFEDQISFLDVVMDGVKSPSKYAKILVANYKDKLKQAVISGLDLPTSIEKEMKASGVLSDLDAAKQLGEVIDSIPKLLTTDIKAEDQGVMVSLLQIYLIFRSDGDAHARLKSSGQTGYFGPVTAAALAEYQTKIGVKATGVYDSATREALLKN